MKKEAEIRARIKELKEKMVSIKAEARKETFGIPNYKNFMLYSNLIKESMSCYHDIAMLLWVLDEYLMVEIDLLTRLDPADEERISRLIAKKIK